MNQSLSFSIQCYQWGANQTCLSLSSTAPQGKLDHLTESMKGVARCVYMLAVSTFIAPCGTLYHASQAIIKFNRHSWTHLNASKTDFIAFLRGCAIPIIVTPLLLTLSFVFLSIGFKAVPFASSRSLTILPIFLGIGCGVLAYSALKNDSHLFKAWNKLEEIEDSLANDHLDNLMHSPGGFLGVGAAIQLLVR